MLLAKRRRGASDLCVYHMNHLRSGAIYGSLLKLNQSVVALDHAHAIFSNSVGNFCIYIHIRIFIRPTPYGLFFVMTLNGCARPPGGYFTGAAKQKAIVYGENRLHWTESVLKFVHLFTMS